MRDLGKILLLISTSAGLTQFVLSQNGQSLGDLARQAREQNQQKENRKDASDGQTAQSRRIFTDQDNSSRSSGSDAGSSTPPGVGLQSANNRDRAQNGKLSADQWKAKILSAKNAVSTTQKQMDAINASIRFASPTCYRECAQRNERAIAKERQVERLRVQLEEQKKQLADLQESARQQGYGNAVYDPN